MSGSKRYRPARQHQVKEPMEQQQLVKVKAKFDQNDSAWTCCQLNTATWSKQAAVLGWKKKCF